MVCCIHEIGLSTEKQLQKATVVVLLFIFVWKSLKNDPKHTTSDYCFPMINQLQNCLFLHHFLENREESHTIGVWNEVFFVSPALCESHVGHTFQSSDPLTCAKSLFCKLFVQMEIKKNLHSLPPKLFRTHIFKTASSSTLFLLYKMYATNKTQVWEGTSHKNSPKQIIVSQEIGSGPPAISRALYITGLWWKHFWDSEAPKLPGTTWIHSKDSLIFSSYLIKNVSSNFRCSEFSWALGGKIGCRFQEQEL